MCFLVKMSSPAVENETGEILADPAYLDQTQRVRHEELPIVFDDLLTIGTARFASQDGL